MPPDMAASLMPSVSSPPGTAVSGKLPAGPPGTDFSVSDALSSALFASILAQNGPTGQKETPAQEAPMTKVSSGDPAQRKDKKTDSLPVLQPTDTLQVLTLPSEVLSQNSEQVFAAFKNGAAEPAKTVSLSIKSPLPESPSQDAPKSAETGPRQPAANPLISAGGKTMDILPQTAVLRTKSAADAAGELLLQNMPGTDQTDNAPASGDAIAESRDLPEADRKEPVDAGAALPPVTPLPVIGVLMPLSTPVSAATIVPVSAPARLPVSAGVDKAQSKPAQQTIPALRAAAGTSAMVAVSSAEARPSGQLEQPVFPAAFAATGDSVSVGSVPAGIAQAAEEPAGPAPAVIPGSAPADVSAPVGHAAANPALAATALQVSHLQVSPAAVLVNSAISAYRSAVPPVTRTPDEAAPSAVPTPPVAAASTPAPKTATAGPVSVAPANIGSAGPVQAVSPGAGPVPTTLPAAAPLPLTAVAAQAVPEAVRPLQPSVANSGKPTKPSEKALKSPAGSADNNTRFTAEAPPTEPVNAAPLKAMPPGQSAADHPGETKPLKSPAETPTEGMPPEIQPTATAPDPVTDQGKPLSAADRAEVVRQTAHAVQTMPLPAKPGGTEQMSLLLHPKDWGSLQVSVTVAPGGEAGAAKTVTAHIVAETPQVKAALQGQTIALHQALKDSGLHLTHLTVSVSLPDKAADSQPTPQTVMSDLTAGTDSGFSRQQGEPSPQFSSFAGNFQNGRHGQHTPAYAAASAAPEPELEENQRGTPALRPAWGRIDTHA